MVSFTGSTRAGSQVAGNAASPIKRVAQELGGKSANIVLDDLADERFDTVVPDDIGKASSQLGTVLQRALTHARARRPHGPGGERIAAEAAQRNFQSRRPQRRPHPHRSGRRPTSSSPGSRACSRRASPRAPSSSRAGLDARRARLEKGYYVQPTVFSHVSNDMAIAREEIFGPVMS